MLLPDNIYNVLKWTTQYLLPAVGALYFALSQIWGLPFGEQVLGTAAALDIFLSTILGLSSHEYNKAFPKMEDGGDLNKADDIDG